MNELVRIKSGRVPSGVPSYWQTGYSRMSAYNIPIYLNWETYEGQIGKLINYYPEQRTVVIQIGDEVLTFWSWQVERLENS